MTRTAAFLLALLAAAPAWAGIAARPQAAVDRDMIVLSDVFDGVPQAKAATAVMRAPAPGQRTVLDASALSVIAQTHGLSWAPAARGERTVIERTAYEVPREAVIAALTAALARQGLPGDAEITLDNDRFQLVLPSPAPAAVGVSQLRFEPMQGRFQAVVTVPAGDPAAESVRVSGRVAQMVEVPVLARPVMAGEVIRDRDLDVQRLPAGQVRTAVADASRVVGRTARRALPAGQPLKASDLNVTNLIAKNAIVNVRVISGSIALVMQGKALDDGAEGDQVRVLNTRSNRTVQGVVSGPNLVTVQTGLAAVAN